MQALALAIVLTLGAAPPSARFLFSLDGLPVGVVDLSVDGDTYRYQSTQLLRAADGGDRTRVRAEEVKLRRGVEASTGLQLESLWLWRGPPKRGCVNGRSELSETRGKLCAVETTSSAVSGTVFGQAFEATYDPQGLSSLRVGPATFQRHLGAVKLTSLDLLTEGLPIEGGEGKAVLDPPLAEPDPCASLRPVAEPRLPVLAPKDEDTCLDLAREARRQLAKAGVQAGIVHGFLLEGDRARPHAWLRVGARALDPTMGSEVREGVTHLTLTCVPSDDATSAGALWLQVLGGKHRVRRGP